MSPDSFFVLLYADKLTDASERCWSQLKSRLVAGYQVMLPSDSSPSQRDAYYIAEGEFPRDEIESCVRRAFKSAALEVHLAGELVAFTTSAGTVYAAWRGRFLVIGGDRQITAALHTPTSDTSARWRALIEQTPRNAPMWVLSIDQRPTNFSEAIGAPTTDIMFSLDQIQRTPHPLIAGRFVGHYPSAAMAAKSAAWIKSWSTRGEFPFVSPPPKNMVDLYNRMAKQIAGLKLTQEGNRVQIEWDSDKLGGIDKLNSFMQLGGN